jgi:hypothetical protein
MPWDNANLDSLIEKAKNILKKHFDDKFDTKIRVCTISEIQEETIKEAIMDGKSTIQLNRIKLVIPYLRGKYFHYLQEIWLVEEKGDFLFTIVHELLHSIQKCDPKRETINFFICYKILEDSSRLTDSELKDWLEIEKNVGFEKIKHRLLTPGHCEEF